ncbi:GtrA family protein [Pararhizobium sp.]|uniref:GtrA family protein n=1 Tax=Pararhizobium sp. TaxID=1977563 RepID=UPI00271F25D1|nr:GtrA family protein [Pararhizobium sp.]MDO9417783.1 GtrA family protein [Pararhizobium sp.]
MKRLVWFALAGATGFAIDAAVLLLLLTYTGLGPFIARLIAIALAMTATFVINRTWAFGASGRPLAEEGARYGGVGISTSIANYAIYSGLLVAIPATPPPLALVIASGLATVLSYIGYSRFVFGK